MARNQANMIALYETGSDNYVSFRGVCQAHLAGQLEDALRNGIETTSVSICSQSRAAAEPDSATLLGFDIKSYRFFMDYEELPVRIKIDAIVKATIRLEEYIGSKLIIETTDQWYQMDCHATLQGGTVAFTPVELITIYDKDFREDLIKLDDYLVPRMKKENLDGMAAYFFKACGMDGKCTGPVSPKKIAATLGLDIECVRLTRSGTLMSELLFNGGGIDAYDDGLNPIHLHFDKPTILVDYEASRRNSAGRVSMPILHECIHYVFHRPFYELQLLKSPQLSGFSCEAPRHGGNEEKDPVHWIEKQTCQLTPRVMMPVVPFTEKAHEILDMMRIRYPKIGRLAVYEKAIPLIADHFNSSVMSTKIRMEEVGYADVKGVLEYNSSGKLIPAFEVSRADGGMADSSLIYTISIDHAVAEAERNPDFKSLLMGGQFAYVESHFCILSDEYVRPGRMGMELTPYARHHIDECCLGFFPEPPHEGYEYSNGILQCDRKYSAYALRYAKQCKAASDSRIANYALRLSKVNQVMPTLPASFGETLTSHMERLDVTKGDLVEVTHISDSTITRLRNGRCKVKKEHVLTLSFGMLLEPEFIEDMLAKSNNELGCYRPDTVYKFLVWNGYDRGLPFCNSTLIDQKLKPLSCSA